eukprot:CAMPEP_0198322010 /NCGR_PEP_ID=MMETSP1450-20131203/10592_1 /TAXON_ID=753684 ORGANISM="Madagascaria erythrocladiodes, Strain CCMP3234" /NCGR_SAMPLE_ID=MMETSP1450 /ASSEMBLY_ACC=CAM_ASM_001115 /LENGTH=159 /DNA_ID=CAMNT_0044025597 /DNA_START=67 /DNA_END=546 /DNA_ORIENTATION=-
MAAAEAPVELDTETENPVTGAEAVAEAAEEGAEGESGGGETKTKEELVEEALNCPCISKMKEGSCGSEFVAAYRCFLESEEEPKGMDCVELFSAMQNCMVEHADEYDFDEDEDDPVESAVQEKAPEEAVEPESSPRTTTSAPPEGRTVDATPQTTPSLL